MKKSQFVSSSVSPVCHPLALPAFELTQLIFSFQNTRQVSLPRLKLLNRKFKLTALSKEKGEVFFEGWMPLICGIDVSGRKVLKGSISNIKERAWIYALNSIVLLSCKRDFIYNISLFFEHAPRPTQARLFSCKLPHTVLARTVEFTGESRATVRHALKRGAENA